MNPCVIHSFRLTIDYLRRLTADIREADWTRQPPGVPNHPAWVVGHIIMSCQGLSGEIGLPPWLPSHWAATYGTGSRPVSERSAYPPASELSAEFDRSTDRLIAAVTALSAEQLAADLPDEKYRPLVPTIEHAFIHVMIAHTAVHVGQISVWRRAAGYPPLTDPFV